MTGYRGRSGLYELLSVTDAARHCIQPVPDALKLRDDIARFVTDWLPKYGHDNRSYLTVAIGCTGGQHRSVWMTEWLATQFANRPDVLVRHRELVPEANPQKTAAAR